MKIAILGFGREGQSLLRFLKKSPHYKNAEIWLCDRNEKLDIPRGARGQLGNRYLNRLKQFDIIFRSPGIPYNLPQIQEVKKRGVEISSVTKLFFKEFSIRFPRHSPLTAHHPPFIIGITGTKGKGTTATLLYKMLRASGKNAYLAGNIGKPAIDLLSQRSSVISHSSFVILELSSFQLQDLETSPHIAAVLDIFPDHQDLHRNLKEYFSAKANIACHQKKNDFVFFSARNRVSRAIAQKSKGGKIAVHETRFGLFKPSELKIPGVHNLKNAAMAATVARALGVSASVIRRVATSFRGLPHRLQFLGIKNGVSYYDDSAAVNPTAAVAALRAVGARARIVLIAGGKERRLSYAEFAAAICRRAKAAILIGENKRAIRAAIQKIPQKKRVAIRFAADMREAVRAARALAKPGDAILLAPASASFDMFKNYEERGKVFTDAVRAYLKK